MFSFKTRINLRKIILFFIELLLFLQKIFQYEKIIIPYYPDCAQSSFGPTWHTIQDDMDHIDLNTLQAVGQTLVQVLFSE